MEVRWTNKYKHEKQPLLQGSQQQARPRRVWKVVRGRSAWRVEGGVLGVVGCGVNRQVYLPCILHWTWGHFIINSKEACWRKGLWIRINEPWRRQKAEEITLTSISNRKSVPCSHHFRVTRFISGLAHTGSIYKGVACCDPDRQVVMWIIYWVHVVLSKGRETQLEIHLSSSCAT